MGPSKRAWETSELKREIHHIATACPMPSEDTSSLTSRNLTGSTQDLDPGFRISSNHSPTFSLCFHKECHLSMTWLLAQSGLNFESPPASPPPEISLTEWPIVKLRDRFHKRKQPTCSTWNVWDFGDASEEGTVVVEGRLPQGRPFHHVHYLEPKAIRDPFSQEKLWPFLYLHRRI